MGRIDNAIQVVCACLYEPDRTLRLCTVKVRLLIFTISFVKFLYFIPILILFLFFLITTLSLYFSQLSSLLSTIYSFLSFFSSSFPSILSFFLLLIHYHLLKSSMMELSFLSFYFIVHLYHYYD